MSVEWVKLSKRLVKGREQAFEAVRRELCSQARLVVLFGSRARGEHTPLSDYDLLVVVDRAPEKRVQVRWPAQTFTYSLEEARQGLAGLDTILLDALTEGRLLCGDEALLAELKALAEEVVRARRLRKTPKGWMAQ
jgi:hypothetical protein